jgi:4-amino-4-deoxy-L-arabinose transferase-like glycosyltransferase
LLAGFFPWSLFAWPVANDIGHKLKTSWHGPIVFLLCWVGVQVTLFSLAATKLPSYVTPCYPALALLAAYTLVRFQHGRSLGSPIWFQGSLVILVLVSILLAIAFVVLAERYLQGKWQIALVAAPLFVAAVWGLFYFRRSKRRAIQGFAWGAITFYVLFWGWGAVIVDSTRDIQRLLTDVRQLPDETRVASYRALESSWIFYGQRPIHELGVGKLSVDNAPLSLVRQRDWNPWPTLSPEQFAELDPHAVYLTTGRFQNELLARLPPGYQVLAQAPYFLKDEQVVLIGSAPRD